MLKIIAGEFRSRRLRSPPDEAVSRPYAQRAKEAVFNLLREWIEDARVLDLFAGVGTMGLEAISRGASTAVMVERNVGIHALLEQNIESLGRGDRAVAVCADALGQAALLRAPRPVDVVFVDPPYAMLTEETARRRVLALAAGCGEIMAASSLLVLRSPVGPEQVDLSVEGLDGPEAHRYGMDMWVLIYGRPRGDTVGGDAGGGDAGGRDTEGHDGDSFGGNEP